MKPKIYVAGPLGFSEAGRHFHEEKFLPMLRVIGFEVLDPWDFPDDNPIQVALDMPHGPEREEALRRADHGAGQSNAEMIKESHLVVAVLDGADVDSGTAAEIGFAAGLLKPIVGYRGDFRLSSENLGTTVNLQVEYFIRSRMGDIVRNLDDLHKVLTEWYEKYQREWSR